MLWFFVPVRCVPERTAWNIGTDCPFDGSDCMGRNIRDFLFGDTWVRDTLSLFFHPHHTLSHSSSSHTLQLIKLLYLKELGHEKNSNILTKMTDFLGLKREPLFGFWIFKMIFWWAIVVLHGGIIFAGEFCKTIPRNLKIWRISIVFCCSVDRRIVMYVCSYYSLYYNSNLHKEGTKSRNSLIDYTFYTVFSHPMNSLICFHHKLRENEDFFLVSHHRSIFKKQ